MAWHAPGAALLRAGTSARNCNPGVTTECDGNRAMGSSWSICSSPHPYAQFRYPIDELFILATIIFSHLRIPV